MAYRRQNENGGVQSNTQERLTAFAFADEVKIVEGTKTL